jgi:hypothetical protein
VETTGKITNVQVSTGKILIATGEGWESNYKILKRLNSVPAEYRKIEGYDWFTGNFK